MRICLKFLAAGALISNAAFATTESSVSNKVYYQAVDVLAKYLAADLADLAKITKKTSIMHYSQSEALPPELQQYVLKKIETLALQSSDIRFVQCTECLTLKAEARGDEVFISKGITTQEELKEQMGGMQIRNYGDVNLAYAGNSMILQMSMVDANQQITWAKEYKTPANSINDSQWQAGASFEAVSFQKKNMPNPSATRVYLGQRLFGIGSVGISAALVDKSKNLAPIGIYSTYFELNHNEFFASYWNYVQLSYTGEVGIADFNSYQQLAESIGVKATIGQYFTTRLALRTHQFLKKPDDRGKIFNEAGEPIIRNDEALPPQLILGVGVELL